MTKQEKIKKEWGSFYTDKVSPDGWLNIHPKNYSNDELFDRLKFNSERDSIRPKTLQGVEHNHGWTKIEKESDLPTIGEYYTIASFDNLIVEREFPHPKFSLEFNKEWWLKYITHYQQIIKPEKPLY